ncbi:RNA 2',3'-cyclic phosphodiesterase [Bacillus sp. FJAT-45037]|uniref:RNA 2',3'-cyclic phosphodiesterase n=1 Tax=Bacillus sp. FJAT-45037 TaxID=2011007 RepID=UPI000C2341F7|nr:RNA 2',3'-cyclic phosphodiesterase [Bacillus sp. FJAT-45037]
MNDMHYFLSIPISDQIKDAYKNSLQQLKDAYPFKQWVHPDDLHITLVFLGALSDETKQELTSHVQQVTLEDQTIRPFSLKLTDLQTFGKDESPRIFWVDVEGEADRLHQLYRQLKNACVNLGCRVDERPYRPHLTIAKRWKGTHDFSVNMTPFDEQVFRWDVSYVSLMKIDPSSQPKYTEIERFELGKMNE